MNVFKKLLQIYLNLPILKKMIYTNIIIISIPAIILPITANNLSKPAIVNKTIDNSVTNLKLISRGIDSLLDNVESTSRNIVLSESLQHYIIFKKNMSLTDQYSSELIVKSELEGNLETRNSASSAIILVNDGTLIFTGLIDPTKARNTNTFVSNTVMPSIANLIWTGMQNLDIEYQNQYLFSLFRKIINPITSENIGKVVLNVQENTIAEIFSNLKYGESGSYFITDNSGAVISSGIKSDIGRKLSGIIPSFHPKSGQYGEIVNINHKSYLLTSMEYKRLQWYVMGLVPLNEITNDSHQITTLIYVTGIFCFLLALLSSILISRTITRPLIMLSRAMKTISKGDLDAHVKVQGEDEVGLLAGRFNHMIVEIEQLVRQVETEQFKKKEFELIALQAQIHPHFLYNTLDSVCSLAQLNRNKDVSEMVKALAQFYRGVLSQGSSVITIKEEMMIIQNYLMIQKNRYADKFDYDIDIHPSIMQSPILKLTLQPIIENALYHGIKRASRKGWIYISGKIDDSRVVLSVTDDGVGMSMEQVDLLLSGDNNMQSKGGFGVRSVNESMKLFFGSEYGINQITSLLGHGTKVEITLPMGTINKRGD